MFGVGLRLLPDPTFTIIVATSGRKTLGRTLRSLYPQLRHGDDLVVTRRDDAPWGHRARDEAIARAAGTHLWFMDDDDIATKDALKEIRLEVVNDPDRFHIFRMQDGEGIYWRNPEPVEGNVGTPMMVVPNVPGKIGRFDGRGYEGDANFLYTTMELRGDRPVFHEQIVALIRP